MNQGDNVQTEPPTEEILEEIEHTRQEMSETIDAIQERLNPDHVKEQAMGAVREATIGRAEEAVGGATQRVRGAGSSMLDTIKQNPLPAAMVGIGVGWLVMQNKSNGSSMQSGGQTPDRVRETVDRSREQAGQLVNQAQQQVGDTVGQAQQAVGQAASQLQDTTGQMSSRAQGQFQRLLHESPLAVGGVALALGAAAGLALPETQQEHKLMGQTHDKVMEQVKATASEAQQKVQQVAEEAQKAATEEARNQNLAPQQQNDSYDLPRETI